MNLAFQISSEKGPGPKSPGQVGMGRNSTAGTAVRIEGGVKMERIATARRRATTVRQTTGVQNLRQPVAQISPAPGSRKDITQKFSKLVSRFGKNDLAEITDCTPEAAQHWLDATRGPSVETVFKAARKIGAVQEWAAGELGIDLNAAGPGAEKAKAAIAALQVIACMGGEAGAMAKASLRAIEAGGN
jgi:hypothetical protein